MKKIILVGITVLFALALITCIDAPNGTNENTVPFVQYSADGTRVTINLDGYGDAESSRALSLPIAQEAYNFLEVVFQGDVAGTIARASWERGKAMSITGVPRGATAGINYGTTGGTTPSAIAGNAVMFVGRKIGNDVTLLAVGKIVDVDGTASTTVTPTSKSVTFGLAAITGNTVLATSSFSTPVSPNTTFTFETGRTVTVHSLSSSPVGSDTTVSTSYLLGSSSASALPIAQILPSIIIAAPPSADPATWKEGCQAIDPVYLKPNGEELRIKEYEPGKFAPKLTNNITVDDPFINPITIDIDIAGGAEGVGAFYFTIPVVAITASAGVGGVTAQKWFIRPGINYTYLDNGTPNSAGGSLFIASSESALTGLLVDMK